MPDALVNKTRTEHPQPGIGDNGGPPLQKFTAKHKVERIKEVLELDISAAQKCVGIGVICEADTDWITPELSAAQLQRYASVKDPETVYRATKRLTTERVVNPVRVEGRPNRYVVLPSEAIDAAIDEIDAYVPTTPIPSEPPHPMCSEGSDTTKPLRSDRTTPSDQTWVVGSKPVRSDRTSPIETDRSEPATPIETDTPNPSPSRARAVDNNINKTNTYSTDGEEEKDRGCGGKGKPELALEDKKVSSLGLQALEAFNLYNETALRCAIPQAAKLTPGRKKSIIARLKEYGAPAASGLEAWRMALANIEKSAYLRGCGGGRPGWTADIDFLVQASRFTKVVEGGYGNGAHAQSSAAPPKGISRLKQKFLRASVEKPHD